ncbi:MAG: hypothetical protein ABI807_13415 [Sporichthyaceae bacterium]
MAARSPGELVELVEDAVLLGDRDAMAGLVEPGAPLLSRTGVVAAGDPVELLADVAPASCGPATGNGLAVYLSAAGSAVLVARRDPVVGWRVAAVVRCDQARP